MSDRYANVQFYRDTGEDTLGEWDEEITIESGQWEVVSEDVDTYKTTTPGEYRVFGKRVYFKRGSDGE